MKSLLMLMLLCPGVLGADSNINDELRSSLTIRVTDVSRSGVVTLHLENSSHSALRVFQESNSWGAARWRILLIRDGLLETFSEWASEIFTMNNPLYDEIPAAGHIERRLDLNGGDWCGLGHCTYWYERGFGGRRVGFEPNDNVVVVYDVPYTTEGDKLNVWHGVVAALTVFPSRSDKGTAAK